MSRFIKVLSNELIKIEEYKNPRVCFNNTEYDDIENYCVLRETINPFQTLYKNKELQQRIDKAIDYLKEHSFDYGTEDMIFDKANAYELLEILKGEPNDE